jgi:hypothetical protein
MELIITATATADSDILEALNAGVAQVHSVREDGTLRRRHFLSGKALEEAVWVRAQREGQEADESEGVLFIAPRSMRSIANELHLSVSAIRRVLVDLAITEELLDMEEDELEAMLLGASEE